MIEEQLVKLGTQCSRKSEDVHEESRDTEASSRLARLIRQRKEMRIRCRRKDGTKLEKQIQREIRALARARMRTRIGKILTQFTGLKFITGIRNNQKRHLIGSMLDKDGTLQTGRQETADVFADFYEQLFSEATAAENDINYCAVPQQVEPVSVNELQAQLTKMAMGKAADNNDVVAELLQSAGKGMLPLIADVFNDILNVEALVPKQ